MYRALNAPDDRNEDIGTLFFAASRNFYMQDSDLNEFITDIQKQVFSTEDEPMIAMVQKRMGDNDFWGLKPLLLSVDEAAVRVRRKFRQIEANEHPEWRD